MAKKIKLDLSQFKASGVYTLEFDASENIILTSQTIRLVVGFSNKGPFNAPVYIPDVTTAVAIFGDIDKNLESQGSYFQRSILTCLATGPVFALNLLRLNNDVDSPTADKVDYFGFSVATDEPNGVLTSRLYSSFYNKERFWFADVDYFLATMSVVDQGRIFNLVNLGQQSMSVIVRKSTDATPPLQGYDVFAIDWYGANNVPSYVHPYDYISDWFIDVIAVSGDWTDYQALSEDPEWSAFFTPNGFIKSQINNFLSQQNVNIITQVTGCLILDFVDLNGNNQFIQTLVNNNTPSTGLFCAVDAEGLEYLCQNRFKVDLVGNFLIDELTGDRDLADPKLNFLSYDQQLIQDYLYTQNSIGITGGGVTGGTAGVAYIPLNVGTLFNLGGPTGPTAGVPASSLEPYDPSLTFGGLHYLRTKSGVTGGAVVNVWVGASGGSGYTTAPTVTFVNPAGATGASAYAVISSGGSVTSIVLTSGGSGYTTAPTISLTGGGGSGAQAYAEILTQPSLTSAEKLRLKDFVTPTPSYTPFILGTVTIPAAATGNVINQFTTGDLVKLKITGVREISGNLTITFTHPLDTPVYASQGIQVSPTSFTMGTTSGTVSEFYQQFGASDYLDIVSVASITGGTASNSLTGQLTTNLYQNILYREIEDGDIIWLNETGTNLYYLDTQLTVDRDQFNVSYVRAFDNVARQNPDDLVNYPTFGTVYASDNIGLPVSAGKTDIISNVASINQFLDVLTKIDSTSFTFVPDQVNNKIISVGDYLVSTDLELCETVGANRQSRLTKVTSVAQTTTAGVVRVTCARPIFYYAGSPIQVQKFKSIPQFTRSFDFIYLSGYTMRDAQRPNGTDLRVDEILNVLYDTNLAATLATKDVISFRYIVDTFSGTIQPNSKYQLSKLAMMRQKALAFINAPSMAQFRASTDPRFTNAPTAVDPFPPLEAQYIAEGGNLSLNPSYTFSLPTQDLGASFAGYFTPYITIRENNRNTNVPPAAYVSNNFVRKFANGEPYNIIAGQKRGTISGGNIVGLEYDFTDEDRGWLEPFGLNPIIKKRGFGVVIFGNQTAYQTVNSAFGLLHVRDLLISLENDVEEILSNYLFDFNEDSIRLEIKTLVDTYLDGVRAGGGIYAYQVIMDASNNPPSVIDMNMGIIDVIIEPARGIQKFINRITVTRTGGIASGGFINFV
jgi:hypothetical protein